LNTFGSKEFSALKIIDFGNVGLRKVVDRRHECIIYMI